MRTNKQHDILNLLKETDKHISGEEIARALKISRSAVWKHIHILQEEGYSIDAHTRLGYRLISVPDRLTPDEIKYGLATDFIGKKIHYYTKTESTNTVASNLALNGAPEGTLVIAEEQSGGRGRLDRKWLSRAYDNILMSLIFRPQLPAAEVFSITMLCSVAIVRAITKTTGLLTLIKWPNDIYINNKKIAGILTELSADQDRVNYVITGIGLNVNYDTNAYPEIRDIATSISSVTGQRTSRIELLRSILEEIEECYLMLRSGNRACIRTEWNKNSLIIGKQVQIISANSIDEGIADSIDDDGSLLLIGTDGVKKKIYCGDVSLRMNGKL